MKKIIEINPGIMSALARICVFFGATGILVINSINRITNNHDAFIYATIFYGLYYCILVVFASYYYYYIKKRKIAYFEVVAGKDEMIKNIRVKAYSRGFIVSTISFILLGYIIYLTNQSSFIIYLMITTFAIFSLITTEIYGIILLISETKKYKENA